MLKEYVFSCQTITPLFLYGADDKSPELRPPSFKGMMRFWWRAIKNLPIKKLQEEEGKNFGSSEEELGRSKFSIRLVNEKKPKYIDESPLKHRPIFTWKAIAPHHNFSIILRSSNENIEKYSNILKVALLLGGLGRRARRGFGSIKINSINLNSFQFNYSLESILSLMNKINNKYEIKDGKIQLKSSSSLSGVYPFLKEIQISHKKNDKWEDLLTKICKKMSKHKSRALGFSHYDRKKERNFRLASPVYVSLIMKEDKKYYPIISTLETALERDLPSHLRPKNIEKDQNAFKEAIL